MEGSIAVENCNNITASKSMESSIKIDSISIDLINANEKRVADICEHFTIRGYVSETRKRDLNLCLPFALDAHNNDCERQKCPLPPLHVPKFRFWRCHNCLSEIDAKGTTNDSAHTLKSCHPDFNSNNICSHVPVLGDSATKLSDFQPASKLDILDVIKVNASSSANLCKANEVHPSLCLDKKEKKSEVAMHNMLLEENVNQEIHRFNCVGTEAFSGAVQKTKHMDDMVAFKSKCNGSTNLYKLDGQHLEVAGSEFPKNLNDIVKGTNAISHTREETSLKDQNKELISQEAGNAKEALNAYNWHINRCTSLESEECNASSSESAEIVTGNDLQDLQDDESSGLRRRKARKVRLLTELLCKYGDRGIDNVRTEDYTSNSIPAASGVSLDASTGINKPPVPQRQLAKLGTARKTLSQTRKRKLSQDEDRRPAERSSRNMLPNEVRYLKGDSENTNAVVHSESEAHASARISLQPDVKYQWSEHKIHKASTGSKKKNKMTMISDKSLSLKPLDENTPDEIGDKSIANHKDNGIDGVLPKPMDNSFTGREIDLFPLPAQWKERNPGYLKKKGKMPQVDDQQAAIVLWSHDISSEGPVTRKDVEIMPSAPIGIPFNAVGETSHEKGLNLSLNSRMAIDRNDRNCVPQVEDSLTSFSAWQNNTFGDQVMMKIAETENVGDFSFASKSPEKAPFMSGMNDNMSIKRPAYVVPFINQKQNHTSQVEVGGSSLIQQKSIHAGTLPFDCWNKLTASHLNKSAASNAATPAASLFMRDPLTAGVIQQPPSLVLPASAPMLQQNFSSTGSNGKTVGTQEHSTIAKKDSGQSFDASSEQGGLDDIPMDIVELMAKNQYERCLPDAECDKRQLAKTDDPRRSQTTDFSNAYGHGKLSLFQQETTKKQKHGNGRNGTIKRAGIPVTVKEKTLDYFSQVDQCQLNIGQLEQTHIPAGFRAPFELQEKFQHFASSSRGQSNAQNCKLVGDISGKRFHHNILQASRTCNTCQHNPQLNKDASHFLSSMIPNNVPFVYSIPQKIGAPPANVDVLSCTSRHGSMHEGKMKKDHDLRFLKSAANIEKQLRNFSPDTLSRTRAEYPFPCKQNKTKMSHQPVGSLDLYSNETIPAMHLLSLVDAGLRSTAPINMEVSAELLKRPPVNHDPSPKQFHRLVPGTYKATNTMKDPPCHGISQLAGNSHNSIRAIPATVGASSSSHRHDNSFKEGSDFPARLSQKLEKRQGSDLHLENTGRLQKSVSASCGFGSSCGSIPVHSMQKIFFGAQDPRMFPLQCHGLDNSAKHRIQAISTTGTVQPHKSKPETRICCLNRNPADFSMADDENEYMITGKDLKISGGILDTDGSRVVRLGGHKRQRKRPTAKEARI